MSYTPATDFVGVWRAIAGGVQKGELPGLDFIVAGLGRAGLLAVTVSSIAPVANQATTAWFQPASPSYSAEGALYLWNANASAYQAATPALFRQFLEVSFGASGSSWFTTAGGPPSNTVGNNGDFAVRTDSPGGVYGPKASGAWPANPLPGTSYSQMSAALDYAFGNPARGSVLFRGSAAWQVLPPGTAGYTLTTSGAGNDPSWTALSNTVNSGALDASFGATIGNMLYRASGGWQSLAIGAANTLLTSNGASPQWTSMTSQMDGVFGVVQGSILYRNATQWLSLAPGTAGYLLSTGGAGQNPSWIAPATATINSAAMDSAFGATVGSVLIRGTGGWAILPPGTAGYKLQTNGAGANPTWAANATPTQTPGAIGSISYCFVNSPSGLGSDYPATWASGGAYGTAVNNNPGGASDGVWPGTWQTLGISAAGAAVGKGVAQRIA